MKKKFNYKLTISLVSLFISLLLLILGNKNNYCLSFGFILMGVAIAFYAFQKSEKFDETLVEIDNDIQEIDEKDTFSILQLQKEKKKFIKQKKRFNFVFYLCAILLVVVGFASI